MAIHWKIPFMSLRSQTLYTVNIYDDDFSGTVVQLTGGAQPFVTEEDDDDDWFLPVRTQSGYISIVDNGEDSSGDSFNWRDLLPATEKSRKVTLTDASNNVVWEGYMQPQTFSGQLYEGVQERSFPVCCPLSVLDGEKYETTANGVVTFAYLLEHILLKTGFVFNNIYVQGSDVFEWLGKKFDWDNLIDVDEDENRLPKYSCLEVLEEICKFWGWTCRIFKNDLYLMSPDDELSPAMVYFDMQELSTIAAGGTAQYNEASWSTADTDDDIYANDDNEIELMRGIRKATVTANINKQEIVEDLPYDEIARWYERWKSITDSHYGDNGHYLYLHGYDQTPLSFNSEDMIIRTFPFGNSTGGAVLVDEFFEGNLAYKHNYNFSTSLMVRGSLGVSSDGELVQILSKSPHNYDHGVFAISGTVSQVFISFTKQTYNANGHLICRLRIGSKWWNGSAWQDAKTYFNMPIGDEINGTQSGTGKIIDNRALNGPYDSYEGYGCPVGEAMGGTIEFDIVGVVLDDAHGYYPEARIEGLTMKFVRERTYERYTERSANEYTEETELAFTGEKSVETIFASDMSNAFGLGIIMNSDGSYCSNVGYSYSGGGVQAHPEQHLVERISNRGMTTKNKEVVHLLSNLVEITPLTLCETLYTSGYPVAISRDWRDDVTTVTIIEK